MGRAEAPASPTTPDLEQAEVEVDGHSWSVRVLGRAAGAGVARVPMLLLGFWSDTDRGPEAERECLVVGQTLDALSEADLERAFTQSRPPIPRPDPEPRERGRRGRRGGATPRHAT
jgi:hypothetical protein